MTWDVEARAALKKAATDPVGLVNARTFTCLTDIDTDNEVTPLTLIIDNGKIANCAPTLPEGFAGPTLDMDKGLIWPAFTEIHTHLDKGHIWPRRQNPDGTFMGALTNVGEDREANWTAKDVEARMQFALQSAYHYGTAAIRTHLDSIGKQIGISWAVFRELRAQWKGRIELQAVSLFGIDALEQEGFLDEIVHEVTSSNGILGAVAYPVPKLETYLDMLFEAASEHDTDLDFHADESLDPTSDCLLKIAEAAKRHRFEGRVLVGHCCSLSKQPTDVIARTIEAVAEAGLGIVSLPLCNLYLQARTYHDGKPGTPVSRGITLLHELKQAGVPVMISSDNTRDPFYAYGDLDALEVYREATRIAHLDHPVSDWPTAITKTPSTFAGFTHRSTLTEGAPADCVLMRARSLTELLSRPQTDRIVLRAGKAIETTLPDYRDLDPIVGKP